MLEQMLNEGKGYRTESYSGSKVRDIDGVVRHEISMGNTDIIDYVQKKYGILQKYQYEGVIDDPEDYEIGLSEMALENAPDIVEDLIAFLKRKMQVRSEKELMCLWLASKEDVIKYYDGIPDNENQDGDIDEYKIPQKHIVISDLGADGTLFVFKTKVFKLFNNLT